MLPPAPHARAAAPVPGGLPRDYRGVPDGRLPLGHGQMIGAGYSCVPASRQHDNLTFPHLVTGAGYTFRLRIMRHGIPPSCYPGVTQIMPCGINWPGDRAQTAHFRHLMKPRAPDSPSGAVCWEEVSDHDGTNFPPHRDGEIGGGFGPSWTKTYPTHWEEVSAHCVHGTSSGVPAR